MSGEERNGHREADGRRESPDSEELLARYVAAIERGEGHSVEERLHEILQLSRSAQEGALEALCREHPELAPGLREGYDLVVRLRALGPQAMATQAGAASSDTAARQTIGPYRILGVLGEGGMGTVFLAEQREPVRRRVALKVIKLGMDTKHVLARFQTERQALAMMEHDCIARVLDAGATGDGRPSTRLTTLGEGSPGAGQEAAHGPPLPGQQPARRSRLDHDEGAREGPHAPLRLGGGPGRVDRVHQRRPEGVSDG